MSEDELTKYLSNLKPEVEEYGLEMVVKSLEDALSGDR